MQLPFPGMDPYLEAPGIWPDVHNRLIGALGDQLQEQISPRYVAAVTPYVTLENIDIAATRSIIPDAGVLDRDQPGAAIETAVIAAAPLTGIIEMQVPTRYHRIEIRLVGDEQLVTVIELLSPANKRPGPGGTEDYDRKRREIFESAVHLIEIDLLRGGRRPPLTTPLPPNPYFVFLSRFERRPRIEIWPLSINLPIPRVPVPLRRPDPDVPLDIGAALQLIYQRARYDLRINYHLAPPPPALPAAELAWLDRNLREHGLREPSADSAD